MPLSRMNYNILSPIKTIPILQEYFKLEKDIQWLSNGNGGRQCGIQYIEGEDPFISATGKLKPNIIETEYNVINPLFRGTIFEEVIKEHKLFRTRLMWAGSKSCYSLHKDKTKRLHIPLITNDQCLFVFPEESKFIYLPSGHAYVVDTTRTHSFCNFSKIPRLHLVGCIES